MVISCISEYYGGSKLLIPGWFDEELENGLQAESFLLFDSIF